MRNKREYEICKSLSVYLHAQYPKVLFHFDLAGLNLSRVQAGMMKSIQGERGFPDLFIAEQKKGFAGLFIELKKEETKILTKKNTYTSPHIAEQANMLKNLSDKGYCAYFAVGFDRAKKIIDEYLG